LEFKDWKSRLIHPTRDMITEVKGFSSGHVNSYAAKKGGKNHKMVSKGNKNGKKRGKSSFWSSKVGIEALNWSITSGSVPKTKMPQVNNKPYLVLQGSEIGNVLTISASVAAFGSIGFTLTLLDQASAFASVFDQYRIRLIETWMIPQFASSNQQVTNWCTVEDYDDATALTTYAAALDYTNVMSTPLSDGHYRRFVPHIAVAAFSGSFSSFENVVAPWIDAASSAVAHYGIKTASLASGAAGAVIMNARLHVQFRNVR